MCSHVGIQSLATLCTCITILISSYLQGQLFVSPRVRERGCIDDSLYVILVVEHVNYLCKSLCTYCDAYISVVMHWMFLQTLSVSHWDMDN